MNVQLAKVSKLTDELNDIKSEKQQRNEGKLERIFAEETTEGLRRLEIGLGSTMDTRQKTAVCTLFNVYFMFYVPIFENIVAHFIYSFIIFLLCFCFSLIAVGTVGSNNGSNYASSSNARCIGLCRFR